jgi:hypothetical protein
MNGISASIEENNLAGLYVVIKKEIDFHGEQTGE